MADEKVPFKKSQVKLAVKALLAHLQSKEVQKKKKNESKLFSQKENLWLMVSLRKIPRTEVKPRKIPLPNPLHKSSEVCMISTQPGKVMRKCFEEKGVSNVQKVISLTKLRKEYKTFELKRQLISMYDVFLCDEKIYHLVVKSLGKECFKRKKEPIPVRLKYTDWKSEIDKCLSSTLLRIGHGPCSSVPVGEVTEHKEKELNENLLHAMRIIGNKIPGNWKNIKSIHIKTSESVALPVYQSSPMATNDLPQVDDGIEDKENEKKNIKQFAKSLREANLEESSASENEDNDDKTTENVVEIVGENDTTKEVVGIDTKDIDEPEIRTITAEEDDKETTKEVLKETKEDQEVRKIGRKKKKANVENKTPVKAVEEGMVENMEKSVKKTSKKRKNVESKTPIKVLVDEEKEVVQESTKKAVKKRKNVESKTPVKETSEEQDDIEETTKSNKKRKNVESKTPVLEEDEAPKSSQKKTKKVQSKTPKKDTIKTESPKTGSGKKKTVTRRVTRAQSRK